MPAHVEHGFSDRPAKQNNSDNATAFAASCAQRGTRSSGNPLTMHAETKGNWRRMTLKQLVIATAIATGIAGCAPAYPPGPNPGVVAGTDWRVVAVNGRATPAAGEFFMNFEERRFGAKFGCNGMGGDYIQRGDIIDPGPVIGTQMACPDMTYENQAGAVLASDMRAVWNGPAELRLVNSSGSIALRR